MMCTFCKIVDNKLFQLLQEWLNLQNAFRCMSYFPLASAPVATNSAESVNTENVQTPPRNFPFSASRFFDPSRNDEIIRNNGGFELVIAPLYKRFLAEVIDTVILFLVKILFFVFFLDFLDIHM